MCIHILWYNIHHHPSPKNPIPYSSIVFWEDHPTWISSSQAWWGPQFLRFFHRIRGIRGMPHLHGRRPGAVDLWPTVAFGDSPAPRCWRWPHPLGKPEDPVRGWISDRLTPTEKARGGKRLRQGRDHFWLSGNRQSLTEKWCQDLFQARMVTSAGG